MDNTSAYDVAIVGAGVVGCAIARRLARYDLRLALIDAASDVGMGASHANSGILHAGYDCAPGSAQARLNVLGNALYDQWCAELHVPLIRCGSMVLAFGPEDERQLAALHARGLQNGVPDLALISGEEARGIEPALSPQVTKVLLARSAGIICPFRMTIACAENARDNGCEWLLDAPVVAMRAQAAWIELALGNGSLIRARYVVNAAGVFADDLARMLGDDSFSIVPRKGEYMLLDKAAANVRTVLFQTPTKYGKGVLVAPTVDGNMFAGPTAVDQTDKLDTSVSAQGIAQLSALSKRSVPDIDLRATITAFAGIRAQPSTGDFIIERSKVAPRLIHAAGICSPGLTAAPAIALEIEQLLSEAGLSLTAQPTYIATREAIPEFHKMNVAEKNALIARDRRYGRIVCRCEVVTEGEIAEAIRRGARTLDAVKRRVRAGAGRCQGGFCMPRVTEILARALGEDMTQVTKFGGGSKLLAGRLKEEM